MGITVLPIAWNSRKHHLMASCERVASILLFSVLLLLAVPAFGGLPRVAISIPTDQNLATGLQAGQQCGAPGKVIVLPPVSFGFASGEKVGGVFEGQTIQSIPEGSEVWLHVVTNTGSLTGKESEQEINQQVDAFVKSMPRGPRRSPSF